MAGIVYTIDFAAAIARLEEGTARGAQSVKKMADQMESASNFAKKALAALGVSLSAGFFVSFLKGTNDAIESMKVLGQDAGTSAEAMSRFEAPARSAGLGLESVAAAMFKISKASLEARDPQSRAAQALEAIGLSTEKIKGLKPDEMFEMVARSISKYSDGLEKNNVMQELFGKSGSEMNRVVAEIAERTKLTATVTEEQAEASKLLNDQMLELKMNSEKYWRSLVSEGVPTMNAIVKAFIDGNKELGIFGGLIDGLSATFDAIFSESLQDKLDKTNATIHNIMSVMEGRGAVGRFFYEAQDVALLNEQLARRKLLEDGIAQAAAEARNKAAGEKPGEQKPPPQFDPAARELAIKRELHFMKLRQEAQEGWGKTLGEFDKLNLDAFNQAEELSRKYQDIANAVVASRASQGEAIANGLRTEAEIENASYTDRLAKLQEYFAQKEDFTIEDQKLLERLTAQHNANLNAQNSLGIKNNSEIERMGGDAQLEYYTSTLAQITAKGAQHSKAMFRLNQIAGIANAIVSTARGAAAALEWGWPLGPIFAAAIVAAGVAQIAAIRNAQYGGSSAPSVGGGSAIPTFPATGTPQNAAPVSPGGQTVINVNIITNGPVVGSDAMQELTDLHLIPAFENAINNLDRTIIGPNSRQAQMFQPA